MSSGATDAETATPSTQDDKYIVVRRLFVKLLALVYLAAFASLATQIVALAGAGGIYPLHTQLDLYANLSWPLRLARYPSVLWLNASDIALQTTAWLGCVLAILVLSDRFVRPGLILLFVLYLSLFHAGQIFMNFQWDYLLLEAGFLAIFLHGGGRTIIWLFRFVLFKLRFLSGISKLISGDTGWSGFTALHTYFETQPLPHLGAWYAHHLPDWLLRFGSGATLFVELVVPFFFFLPRRWRLVGATTTILWQLLIIATSNHNFFNLLTIALCLFLLDDKAITRWLPARFIAKSLTIELDRAYSPYLQRGVLLVALLVVSLSLALSAEMLLGRKMPAPVDDAVYALRPFRIANRYHVFPTMRTERLELVIEGSLDGQDWHEYQFRYKPGNITNPPGFIVPHQPRIDWMIWFVPGAPVFLDWFDRFLDRIMDNEPAVLQQFAFNPFPLKKPKALRVSVYRYRFTTPKERTASGAWWHREYLGPFFPLPGRDR